jgi:hypothetical protein
MRIGTVSHGYLIEPDYAEQRHPVYEGKARRGREWEQFLLEHPGVGPDDVLIASEHEAVTGIVNSVRANDRAWAYINGGISEASLFWTDEPTLLRCKARPDTLRPTTLVDLKTTNARNFSRDRLEQHAIRSGWHIQTGFYVMGAMANGFAITSVILVVAESEPPYDCGVFRLRPDLVRLGMAKCREALDIIAECERTEVWPGIDGGAEIELGVPEWSQETSEESSSEITQQTKNGDK